MLFSPRLAMPSLLEKCVAIASAVGLRQPQLTALLAEQGAQGVLAASNEMMGIVPPPNATLPAMAAALAAEIGLDFEALGAASSAATPTQPREEGCPSCAAAAAAASSCSDKQPVSRGTPTQSSAVPSRGTPTQPSAVPSYTAPQPQPTRQSKLANFFDRVMIHKAVAVRASAAAEHAALHIPTAEHAALHIHIAEHGR